MHDDTTGRRRHRTPWLGLVLVIMASACTGGGGAKELPVRDDPAPVTLAGLAAGGQVLLQLREGRAVAQAEEAVPVVDGSR